MDLKRLRFWKAYSLDDHVKKSKQNQEKMRERIQKSDEKMQKLTDELEELGRKRDSGEITQDELFRIMEKEHGIKRTGIRNK